MQRKQDENLMLVTAVEQYAHKHKISAAAAYALFRKFDIHNLIRLHYGALHLQPLDESYYFAEDILKNRQKWKTN